MKYRIELEADDDETAENIRSMIEAIPAATLTAYDPEQ